MARLTRNASVTCGRHLAMLCSLHHISLSITSFANVTSWIHAASAVSTCHEHDDSLSIASFHDKNCILILIVLLKREPILCLIVITPFITQLQCTSPRITFVTHCDLLKVVECANETKTSAENQVHTMLYSHQHFSLIAMMMFTGV
jgi:hypothetical protein